MKRITRLSVLLALALSPFLASCDEDVKRNELTKLHTELRTCRGLFIQSDESCSDAGASPMPKRQVSTEHKGAVEL